MFRAKRLMLVVGVAVCLAWLPGWAQEETAEPSRPPRHHGPMMGREGPAREEMPQGGGVRAPRKEWVPRELSPEEREKVRVFLMKHIPGAWERLERVRKERPEEFKRHLAEQWKSVVKLMALRKRNPELFERIIEGRKLEMKSRELAASLRKAKTEEERGAIKEDLSGVLNELLDLQHREWEEQIDGLERRLSQLKDMLAKREENRDDIIKRRMTELTGEEDYLSWTFPRWAEVGLTPIPEAEGPVEGEEAPLPEEGGER